MIKIERPGGEDMRHYEPRFDGESAMFALLNRGKKSLVLDLKNRSDRDSLRLCWPAPTCWSSSSAPA